MPKTSTDNLTAIWAKVKPAPEDEGLKLATTELHKMRKDERERLLQPRLPNRRFEELAAV